MNKYIGKFGGSQIIFALIIDVIIKYNELFGSNLNDKESSMIVVPNKISTKQTIKVQLNYT